MKLSTESSSKDINAPAVVAWIAIGAGSWFIE
jgi:hypothetical protein